MSPRARLLQGIANQLLTLPAAPILRVAIDGVDGAGKSTLADELAACLAGSGRPLIRASVDGFHRPRAQRYRRGRDSPLGFFLDSYDYEQLKALLLGPLSPGGSRRYRRACFDHRQDAILLLPEEEAAPGSILLFDGIFLHRPILRGYWDFSLFLEVPFEISLARCAQRGDGAASPEAPSNRRYVEGQSLYLHSCMPQRHASLLIDNAELARPAIRR